ncbi:MAG: zinc ribbon domain-containing protein [Candidatus Dormibacteria bacterium]
MTGTATAKKKRPAPKPPVIRAYALENRANVGKVKRVAAVLPAYQAACRVVQANQMRAFVEHGEKFWNRREPGDFETVLSERYKRSVQNQVVTGLDSWLALAKTVISQLIAHSTLPDETKADLWWLNKSNAHYRRSEEATVPVWRYLKDGSRVATKARRPAPAETLDLLRAMTKHVRKHRVSVPRLWRSRTMTLDGTVAQVERAGGGAHDLWVRVSTLEAGKPVWLPLGANRFFNEAPGELANFAQVTVARDRQVKVTVVKRSEQAKTRTEGPDIALDWGMRSMFATDSGDQLGRRLYPWLRQIDPHLTKLTAELQRQGVKPNTSRRYRRFNQRIRDHVRNETGRVVNRLISLYGPRSLTVEQLDFRDGGMSKQMNRLLTRAGRAAVNEKLAAIQETLGIAVHEVNPAWTSRECSGCGYADERNRKGRHFRCRFCHKCLDADTNGSRVVSRRRSAGAADLGVGRRTVLQHLDARFEARWGMRPGAAENLRRAKERPTTPRPTTDGLVRHPGNRGRGKRRRAGAIHASG